MRRREPRTLAAAVDSLVRELAPRTLLADVQRVWPEAVGGAVAAEAVPAAERDGVLVVSCSSSVWAHELDLMAPQLIDRLNQVLDGPRVARLRCRATPPRAR
jgi:predicted nucleic acid-binding Zn ribbon protein